MVSAREDIVVGTMREAERVCGESEEVGGEERRRPFDRGGVELERATKGEQHARVRADRLPARHARLEVESERREHLVGVAKTAREEGDEEDERVDRRDGRERVGAREDLPVLESVRVASTRRGLDGVVGEVLSEGVEAGEGEVGCLGRSWKEGAGERHGEGHSRLPGRPPGTH